MASIAMFLRSLVESVNYCRPLNHTYFSVNYARNEVERNKWGGDTFNLVVESPSMLLDAGIISSELKDYCQSIWYVMFFAYLCAN